MVSANDDMAVGVVEALHAAGRGGKTKVVGIDGIPDAIQAIADGKMFATVDFSGHDQSYLAVQAAVRTLKGEKVPPEILLPVFIIDQGQRRARWRRTPEERPVPSWDKDRARADRSTSVSGPAGRELSGPVSI